MISTIKNNHGNIYVTCYQSVSTSGATYGENTFYPSIPANARICGASVLVENPSEVCVLNALRDKSIQVILRDIISGNPVKNVERTYYVTAFYTCETS